MNIREGRSTPYKCPMCTESPTVYLSEWGENRGLVPQCHECGAWMERVNDDVY